MLTVGKLREQTALCPADTRVALLIDGKATKIDLIRCYPDTTNENGDWISTFKIEGTP